MAEMINSLNYNNNTYTFALPYGVCSTAAGTAEKTVTVDNFSLETGATVIVKFTNANSIASPTLNVNSTGAKPIYRYGTTVASTGTTTTGWVAGAVQMFTYDGTGWIRDYWNNTTYSNAALGSGYGTCGTAAATTAKVASLSSYALSANGMVSIKFTYNVPASATLNINNKGAKSIYYRGAAITNGIIKAGDVATFVYSSQYHLISIDRWQEDIESIQTQIDALETAFQDGCDTIVAGCTTYGGVPDSNSPADIVLAIQEVADIQRNIGRSEAKVGTATVGDVVEGATFTNSDDIGLVGTIPVFESTAWYKTNEREEMPAGYYKNLVINSQNSYNDGYDAGYTAGQSAGTTVGLTSTTLVNHIKDEKGTNFFNSGTSGTRWSWTNTLGNCKVMIYIAVSKSNWDGSSGVYGYVNSSQVFYKDIYSAYYHNISLNKGQVLRLDAKNSNTMVTDCVIVLYDF